MRVIDLFCGCGGFSEGFRQAGFEVVLAVDNWEVALKSHEANHPECEHWNRDILTITPDELMCFKADVLISSPPCRGYSVMRMANDKLRLKTDNGDLIHALQFLIKEVHPPYWVWENVTAVARYFPGGQILRASSFGVPQRRRRAFFSNIKLPLLNPKSLDYPAWEIAYTITAWEFCGGMSPRGRRFRRWFLEKHGRSAQIKDALEYMGFPTGYTVVGTKHDQSIQIGNAVCPPVARAIAEAIKKQAGGGL